MGVMRRADSPHDQRRGDPNTFVHHPAFPTLPITVPLTFTLTMKACLSETPSERPTFGQIATIFEDLLFEVDTGTYISSSGQVMVRSTFMAMCRAIAECLDSAGCCVIGTGACVRCVLVVSPRRASAYFAVQI